jgi:glycosyltransferase involved in cell wall biosynthesis
MVGDGPERGRVEQHCREHRICQAITFIGSLPLVEEVLVGADLFLLPSENVSFGLAALEAMACVVPVIATAVGGLPEVVTHGETGYLCPVGDVDGMADAALRLLGDDERWQAASTLAAADARERFALEQVVARYEAFYENALGASVRAAGR